MAAWISPACGTTDLAEAGTWTTRTARGSSYRSIPYAAFERDSVIALIETRRSG